MNTGQHSANSHLNPSDVSGEVLPNHVPNLTNGTPETAHYSMQSENNASKQAELPFAGPPTGGLPPTHSPTHDPVGSAVTAAQTLSAAQNQPSLGHSAAPATAADDDLIEKEWVLRAKAIVAKTKDDPHMQNKELNLYKADYIKKRYNKDIKVSEG